MNYLESILLASPIPMACLDDKMTLLNANDSFATILGLKSATELQGKSFSCYFESMESLSLVERFIKSGNLTTSYFQNVLVNRKNKSFRFTLKKILEPKSIIAIYAEDLTALQEKSQELDALKATTEASARMAILGEMTSGIAHEINNPIVVISGLADQMMRSLREENIDREDIQRKLLKIKNTAVRIGKIVKGLKTYGRDGHADPFQTSPVKEIIQDSLALCSDQLRSHEINLIVEDIDPNIKLDCRGTQISQVILNLIGNAKDAIKNQKEDRWIKIGAKDLGGCVQFSLTDSGKGIDPAIRDKILQPFFTTKAVGEGTGLGLTITKKIIESHHGKLSIDADSPNTTFTFVIPKGLAQNNPDEGYSAK